MLRAFIIGAVSAATVALATGSSLAQSQFGTAAEAKALLEKAVAAVKADPDYAVASAGSEV